MFQRIDSLQPRVVILGLIFLHAAAVVPGTVQPVLDAAGGVPPGALVEIRRSARPTGILGSGCVEQIRNRREDRYRCHFSESKRIIDRLTADFAELMIRSPKKTWCVLVALYGLALALSQTWQWLSTPDRCPRPGQATITLAKGPAGGRHAVTLAYRDVRPPGRADVPAIVLLHGTPIAGESFDRLIPYLADSYRLLAPDLPGFGGSSREIPDYSIRAHAGYLVDWIRDLGLPSVHLVGYSMGGGVALEVYRQAPGLVQSLTLLSSIGVQELELLGDYHLNHIVHGLQLGLLTLLHAATPHFGWLDDTLLNVPYARNFFDSDQRPLRGILQQLQPPMLILHGRTDGLVSVAVAQEHQRIVPHSTLRLWDGGHSLLFTRPGHLAEPIDRFVRSVEEGSAPTRTQAGADRIRAAEFPFDWRQTPAPQGISLVLVLLLLAVATYVSEDLTCIAAGLLAARGLVGLFPAVAACVVGIYSGDLLLYLAGRYVGHPALRRAPFRWFLREDALVRSEEWFLHRGPSVIVASRFLPGTRLPTYVAAGVLKMPWLRFSFYFLLAALLWTPVLVGAAYLVGGRVLSSLAVYQAVGLQIAVALAGGLWLVFKILVPLGTFRGRRLLLSRWRRMTRWEFWSPWVFYPPVFLYILYLGLRYRGLTVFTAANPCMPAGGFIGESKHDILKGLSGAADAVARFDLVPGAEPLPTRIERVRRFMEQHGLDYPVVLKPDSGQRGQGVLIARSDDQIRDYLAGADRPVLVQEFAPGKEFGVFYVRRPDQPNGRIFAITDKRPPVIRGDGQHTVEELILQDDRAVCMAEFHLARHAERAYDVLPPGEILPLVEIGTHCLGCAFHDGGWVLSPELEQAIDRISRSYAGFYFGRYDLRTPSVEDFRQGRNFKIVELNGVTSEATNIYDPSNRLWTAYRILFRQWRLAFEIGSWNRIAGVRPASLLELASSVWAQVRPAAAKPAKPGLQEQFVPDENECR